MKDIDIEKEWFDAWVKAIQYLGKDAIFSGLLELGINVTNKELLNDTKNMDMAIVWAENEMQLLGL